MIIWGFKGFFENGEILRRKAAMSNLKKLFLLSFIYGALRQR